jgi:hypothetical protein
MSSVRRSFTGVTPGADANDADDAAVVNPYMVGGTSAPQEQRQEAKDDSDSDDGSYPFSEDVLALYDANARRMCLRCSVLEIVFGTALLLSFWAAYGWSIVVASLSVILGIIGYSRYQTRDSVASQECCCQPVSFIHQQTYVHAALAVISFASIVSSIISAVFMDFTTGRVFAIIAAVASCGIFASAAALHVFAAALVPFCVAAQAARDTQHVIMVRSHRQSTIIEAEGSTTQPL